jgi:Flp pilus assembly protein TadD
VVVYRFEVIIPAGSQPMDGSEQPKKDWLLQGFLLSLLLSAGYLYCFPQPSLVYVLGILFHTLVGVIVAGLLVQHLPGILRRANAYARVGWAFTAVAAALGLVLIKIGTPRAEWKWLYSHIVFALLGVSLLIADRVSKRGWIASRAIATSMSIVVLAALGYGAQHLRDSWRDQHRIANPQMPPPVMDDEGDGPSGPFFPSSAQVYGQQKIPSKFFMESDACKRCHGDIYDQWNSSVHHFSSFNNQWYRKSIEYMQDTVGTKPSKWCGGCHDPAVLYSGLMDTPIREIVHRPEAQAGLGCMMCHSIAQVKSTMGQGDFYLEYPKMHELAASKNPMVQRIHDFVVRLNPEPHRRVFLKPFMRDQTAEFCSSCHKVHLDIPVNRYRWFRGFNEYDNWQASGVSGQGARSFYYPVKPAQCADCHMPLQRSSDAGNIGGFVHSHRFPGANTAVPTANEDNSQLKLTQDFLTNGALSVDIFALSEARRTPKTSSVADTDLSTTFAVGEESETRVSSPEPETLATVTAPLNRVQAAVRRGETVLVDVVVRTKKVGHFFPGGTVDAYDTWLELRGTDDMGKTVFWSGMVEDHGKGPVEKGAHFYRSLQIDGHGNPINKRNAWATRAVVYVRLIPPGAADTVHYRVVIPPDSGNKITFHARLCYRKFSWWGTQFSFVGIPDTKSGREVTPDYDDRSFLLTGSLKGVSAKKEKIPDVPVVTVAENEVVLSVLPSNTPFPQPKVIIHKEDWQRWNDYGIGLLLQGNLKAAQAAFQKVTEADPANPDGGVNIGRVAIQEGDMERARAVLENALTLDAELARTNFFYAKVLRADGNYTGAAQRLRTVLAQYPRDRVALNDLGRVLFLQHKYPDATKVLDAVLAIDPEDLQAHYNLMLCYNGLGDQKRALEHQTRYLRFKADESAQAITGPYRQLHPEDNNERQAIHEHVSVPLSALASTVRSERVVNRYVAQAAAKTAGGSK